VCLQEQDRRNSAPRLFPAVHESICSLCFARPHEAFFAKHLEVSLLEGTRKLAQQPRPQCSRPCTNRLASDKSAARAEERNRLCITCGCCLEGPERPASAMRLGGGALLPSRTVRRARSWARSFEPDDGSADAGLLHELHGDSDDGGDSAAASGGPGGLAPECSADIDEDIAGSSGEDGDHVPSSASPPREVEVCVRAPSARCKRARCCAPAQSTFRYRDSEAVAPTGVVCGIDGD